MVVIAILRDEVVGEKIKVLSEKWGWDPRDSLISYEKLDTPLKVIHSPNGITQRGGATSNSGLNSPGGNRKLGHPVSQGYWGVKSNEQWT